MTIIAAMTEIGNQAGNGIWPSLEAASHWFDRAGVVLAISLLFGLSATVVIIWLGIIKERHWDALREQARIETETTQGEAARANEAAGKAHERAAALETEAERARAAIAGANERAANAEQRAAEAQLALEKFKAPRSLDDAQQQRVLTGIKAWGTPQVTFMVMADPEAVALMQLIRRLVIAAGWTNIGSQLGDIELDGAGVGYGSAVEIQVHPDAASGSLAMSATALARALDAEGIAAKAIKNSQLKKSDAVNIMVGKKP